MTKTIITDLSRVLLFPNDPSYRGSLNDLNNELLKENQHYSFFDFFRLNDDLLLHFSRINRITPVFIFTSQNIQEHPAIKSTLGSAVSGVLSAQELSVEKSEPEAYEKLVESLGLEPEQAVYIDDNQSNLDAAAKIGIKTIRYTNNKATMAKLDHLIRRTS
jgi:FMN phosphatase YigB (HAD superfamily)